MKICMLAYTFYESDNRVMRYAETLVRRGDSVDVISLRKKGQKLTSNLRGVRIFRIQKRSMDEQQGKINYLVRLTRFFLWSSIFLSLRHISSPYNMVHVHSVPDFEVFAALIPKALGASVILDIHDLVPELYASKFGLDMNAFIIKTLIVVERISTVFADHVIIANHIWRDKLVSRGIQKQKISVVLNYPDKYLFYKRKQKSQDDRFLLMYPGTLSKHQGLEIAVRAVSKIRNVIPGIQFHILGGGPERERIERLIKTLGLSETVQLKEGLPITDIAEKMTQANLGIIPKRSDLFGNEAFSTKTLEFIALGVPIIVSDTRIDRYYFNDSLVEFFKSGNVDDLAEKILRLYKDENRRAVLIKNGLHFISQNNWEEKKTEYLRIVDRLGMGITDQFNMRKLYYFLRPLIPRRLQIALRRQLFLKKLRSCQTKWPIHPAATRPPKNWLGWPKGKRFALVLTHDVESTRGLSRCEQIVEAEKELGFRSCFSFVPKRYEVSSEMVDFLWRNEFEVAVHGLYHDGKLYDSHKLFLKRAFQINSYINRWNSRGFYSPSMHHNLEWIHDLHIEYDNSTFDIDPFEPQSDGVGTIFPFIVRKPDGSHSYVELPYTLPQDFTVFVIMQEESADVWRKKLRWIVEHNGMVLLKTHPDYMSFMNEKSKIDEYPADYYFDFLKHIKDEYSDQYWHALPFQMSEFWSVRNKRS
ncbi:MAG: glycosyltransferase [Planctomycetes bacterium]|nr:glycosyltransferase [Planctomycetota bacterium]